MATQSTTLPMGEILKKLEYNENDLQYVIEPEALPIVVLQPRINTSKSILFFATITRFQISMAIDVCMAADYSVPVSHIDLSLICMSFNEWQLHLLQSAYITSKCMKLLPHITSYSILTQTIRCQQSFNSQKPVIYNHSHSRKSARILLS